MIEIREYREEDCAATAKLFYDTVHSVCAADYSPRELDAWADGRVDLALWNKRFLSHDALVATDGDKLVGFADMDASGELDRLYVHKDHQRKGIARALCAELMSRSQAETFSVHASLTARGFFEKMGFAVTEEEKVERNGVTLRRFAMRMPGSERRETAALRPSSRFRSVAIAASALGACCCAVGLVCSVRLFSDPAIVSVRFAATVALAVFGGLAAALFVAVALFRLLNSGVRLSDYILSLACSVAAFVAAMLHLVVGREFSLSAASLLPFPLAVILALAAAGCAAWEYILKLNLGK